MKLTALEEDILQRFHDQNADKAFPAPAEIAVHSRRNTGSGRFVGISSPGPIRFPDGEIVLGHVEMEGLEAGMTVILFTEAGRIAELELVSVGGAPWDGVERPWTIYQMDKPWPG